MCVRFPKPAAHFTAHVHFEQGELLDVAFIDPQQPGSGNFQRAAGAQRPHRGAAARHVHERHLAETIPRPQAAQPARARGKRLDHLDLTLEQHVEQVTSLPFAHEEFACLTAHLARLGIEQLEDVATHTAKYGHCLQLRDPRLIHRVPPARLTLHAAL